MIRVEALHFSFPASLLFSGLDFRVTSGEVLSIIGPNGCGKSTLLRLLRGNLTPQKGKILWNGTPVVSLSRQNMARRVSVVPQSVHTDFPYRVDEMVAMGRYPHRRSLLSFSTRADRQAIRHALAITDIAHLQTRPVTQLSGGELQRVFIARALAQSTEVLFLDEATSHLDIDHRLDISELLVRLNKDQGTTIVQVSHDLDMAAAMSDRILLLNEQGEKISSGKPAEVMTAANLHRVFRVNVRVGTNPLTGTPVILPLMNTSAHQLDHLKVHLFCGGGSGSAVLRKLHLAGAEVTVGPLNQGDADETLAAALNLPYVKETPFSPYSRNALNRAAEIVDRSDTLVIATLWWGAGNLPCLDLAAQALRRQKTVYLVNQQQNQDYTAGRARQRIERLQSAGAIAVDNAEELLRRLAVKQADADANP